MVHKADPKLRRRMIIYWVALIALGMATGFTDWSFRTVFLVFVALGVVLSVAESVIKIVKARST